jgi:chemotaxis protein MotB
VRRKKKHETHVNHERWLVSYADFITLLFAFFVVLYSAAQVDKKKMGQLSEAIQVAFGHLDTSATSSLPVIIQASPMLPGKPVTLPSTPPGKPTGPDLQALRKDLEEALSPEIQRGEISIRDSSEGLVISLQEIGFFESGSAEMKAKSQSAISSIASLLSRRQYQIRIEGHTDNIPIHNPQFQSNWELSTARSIEMVKQFIILYQFVPEMLSAAGYAEYHPVASNETEAGRAKNRRVDIVILGRRSEARR